MSQLENVINLKQDLAELLNKVQHHSCQKGYCQVNKNSQRKCRFNFPKPLVEESFIKIDNANDIEFNSKRNDENLNKFNPYIILNWRANMDIAPVLSKTALVNYLEKYVSKSEPKSKSLVEILNEIANTNCKSVKSVIQKVFIKSCTQRDYSAQEVGHFIMSEKYVSSSRAFVNVFLPKNDEWVMIEDDNKKGLSIVEKYMQRSNYFDKKIENFLTCHCNGVPKGQA
ncbi:LOW QUALITY PROTEIN: putative ribonuclease [Frankliniella fusca]|uniref:Ribonuclease n=1 Tax=Frankliniella fusca TaxID=407009 RepID=A0AAE1LJK1_9NEOP|nr:LOW QUALITY PROTEIN: putative ribonuclease [Frankliniella fusca]